MSKEKAGLFWNIWGKGIGDKRRDIHGWPNKKGHLRGFTCVYIEK